MFKRRHQRTHHRDDLARTDHQRRRRIGQATDDTRNEEGIPTDEVTERLHQSAHRHFNTRTTEEHHTEQMGPMQQRNRGASTHRGKRFHRTRHRHWQHLCERTNLQRTQTTPTLSLKINWTVRTGDISVAFLHAAAATEISTCIHLQSFTTKQAESFGSPTKQSTAWEVHQKLGKHI